MLEMVRIEDINKSDIWKLEDKADEICAKMSYKYSNYFFEKGYLLEVKLERFDHISALKGKAKHLHKEQCFELEYNSSISIAIKNLEGQLIEFDEGSLVDNINIWSVQKYLLFYKRGFINRLTELEIENQIVNYIKEDAMLLGIELDNN